MSTTVAVSVTSMAVSVASVTMSVASMTVSVRVAISVSLVTWSVGIGVHVPYAMKSFRNGLKCTLCTDLQTIK